MLWAPFHYKPLDEWFMGMFGTLPEPSEADLRRLEAAMRSEFGANP